MHSNEKIEFSLHVVCIYKQTTEACYSMSHLHKASDWLSLR
jgi:hypothetical protein